MLDTTYPYKPLCGDDIRLIDLQPGSHGDDIYIRIVHKSLIIPEDEVNTKPPTKDEVQATLPEEWEVEFETPEGQWIYIRKDGVGGKTCDHPLGHDVVPSRDSLHRETDVLRPRYEALSYSWGDKSQQRALHVVQGSSGSQVLETLSITANLDAALRHLRHASEERILWIDAICIDQNNIQERNAQVLRMRLIYSQAQRVVVWLGPESNDSNHALSTMEYLGKQIDISVDYWRFEAQNSTEENWHSAAEPLPYDQSDWDALESLFSRSWFVRLWTLQEIAVARQSAAIFQCGYTCISWRYLRRAIIALSVKVNVPPGLSASARARQPVAYGAAKILLEEVLPLSRTLECQDPRDHVYGILSFFGPNLRQQMERPDYGRAVEEVYKDVFIRYCEISNRLDLLAHARDRDESDGASWVVSWRNQPVAQALSDTYQAAGVSQAYFNCTSEDVLEARGMVLTTLSSVYRNKDEGADNRLAAKLRGLDFQAMTQELYITGEPLERAWSRVLIGDSCIERYPDSDSVNLDSMAAIIAGIRKDNNEAFEELQTTREVIRHQSHNRIFHTQDGHIGFGPEDIQVGDRICVLLGLFAPLVVRHTAHGCFRIIGRAYVHGIMDGEALLGPLPDGWRVLYKSGERTHDTAWYVDGATGREQKDDPRLKDLPSVWQRIDLQMTSDDPKNAEYFKNRETGEVINYDPRMSLAILEERGVKTDVLRFV